MDVKAKQFIFLVAFIFTSSLYSCVTKYEVFQLRLVHPENDKLVKGEIQRDLTKYDKFLETDGDKSVPIWVDKTIELDLSDLQSASVKSVKPFYVKMTPEIRKELKKTLSDDQIELFGDGFSMGGETRLNLIFNPKGTRNLEEITRTHIKKRIAIIVDGKFIAAPVIMEAIRGGNIQLLGKIEKEDVEKLVAHLNKNISGKKL